VRKIQLNGGYYFDPDKPGIGIDSETDASNWMFAFLETALIQAPHWFDLNGVMDPELIGKVFKEVSDFEYNFFRPSGEQATDLRGSENGSGSESEGARDIGRTQELGRGEVPPSLDP
jgi:hypothetical protein